MSKDDPAFTFRAAQIFVAAVEAQSVTRAAHRLGMSPSSVSQQLSTLETALGTKLIERSARQFRLTRAGQLFLDPARQILDDVAAAKATLVAADHTPPLSIKVASIEEMDALVTAPWLLRLGARFPNMALSLTSGASHENLDALSSRAVDAMIAVDTVSTVDWVEQHPLIRDPFILVSAPGPVDVSRPFVRYGRDLQIGRQIEAQLRRTGTTPDKGFEFTTNQALFAMTAELGGWAITTALAYLGTARAGELVQPHPLPFPKFARRLALHTRAGALNELPKVFAKELREVLRQRIDRAAIPFLADDFIIFGDSE